MSADEGSMTTAEASGILGVTVRQVQRLIDSGALASVGSVGRSRLIDASSVHRLAGRPTPRGRPWNEATAWAAMELLATGSTDRLTGSQRSRLRSRLRTLTPTELLSLARRRATVRHFRVAESFLDALRSQVNVTGACAVAEFPDVASSYGLASGGVGSVDGYVTADRVGVLVDRFVMITDAAGTAVIRVVTVEQGARAMPIAIALDLAESLDPRERSAGRHRLDGVLSRHQ